LWLSTEVEEMLDYSKSFVRRSLQNLFAQIVYSAIVDKLVSQESPILLKIDRSDKDSIDW